MSVWRSLFPRWARVHGYQAEKPRGRTLFEPLLSPWFDAVHLSVVGCLCQALQEVPYFRPLQRQSLSLPPSLKFPHPLNAAVLSSRAEQQGHWVFPCTRCLWSETTVMHSFIQPYQSRHQERKKNCGGLVIHSTCVVQDFVCWVTEVGRSKSPLKFCRVSFLQWS